MTSRRLAYRIAMPEPHTHLFEVEVLLRDAAPGVVFQMPAWTPGSYLIREYARHVQDVVARAEDGRDLHVAKIHKAGWQVTGFDGPTAVRLSYRVYAHDLTVRTSHLTGTHGYFNGACVFVCPEGLSSEPSTLEVVPWGDWTVSIGLPRLDEPGFRFAVADFDQLVDSPGECGSHQEIHFEAAGVNHRWAVWGPGAEQWHSEKGRRALEDVAKLIEVEAELFGGLPHDVDDYLFIVHLLPSRGGGLEHKNSQTIHLSSDTLRNADDYEDFLTLVAHEYWHVWNVKRIRAAGLGPFNYGEEAYTPLLWMMEGITAFYDTIIPTRAGLIAPDRYLTLLGKRLATCRNTPGRHVRTLEENSYDAWIKLYRRDENTGNTSVSYYLKGELAVVCMDLHIRQQTDGARSFDDIMRLLWRRQQETGEAIEPDEVAGLFEQATGVDLTEQLEAWVAGTDDLPLEDYLGGLGIAVEGDWKALPKPKPMASGEDKGPAPWLGITTSQNAGSTRVATVRSDGPCANANIYPGDELVAIDGRRVDAGWDQRLAVYEVGDEVELLLFRRKSQCVARAVLSARPPESFKLGLADDAPAPQIQARLTAWLGAQAPELWTRTDTP